MSVFTDMNEIAPDGRALAEAERWFVRLRSSDCTNKERAAFERWCASAEHAAAYRQTERLWRRVGGLAGNARLDRLATEALTATEPRRREWARSPWRTPAMLATATAACAACVIAILLITNRASVSPSVAYVTSPEQRRTVTLTDGSRVVLNVDTRMTVGMSDDARELMIEHGEALFDVAHDPRRPFRVSSGGGEVTALGTRFQVSSLDERITITLLEGSVQVERAQTKEHLQLRPGEQAAFAVAGGRIETRTVDPEVVSSWTRGRLLFRSTPLIDVVAEVNRYAKTRLRLADPSLEAIPVSGTFPIGNSQSVALALQALLPVDVDMNSGQEIILRRR